ncbi:MAG: hypothetical protein WBH50_13155 [Fuerstiella sp.]
MSQYLNVKDATKFVGKSESTIKRLLREVTSEPDHPDRHYIQPSHDEVEARKAAAEPYAWKIDQDLLTKRYPQDAGSKQGTGDDNTSAEDAQKSGAHDVIISVLREQLQSKDRQLQTLEQQLDRKDEQIGNQNERMREQNILMKDLQQRLAITAPARPADAVVESVTRDTEQGSDAVEQDSTNDNKKRSFWQREFRLFGR